MTVSERQVILKVQGLSKHFAVTKGSVIPKVIGTVKAVEDLSFSLKQGETLAIVGESGCGKTTAGRLLLSLLEPTAGKVFFEGQDIFQLPKNELRTLRSKMQIIFQDPFASLNPRMSVGETIAEPLKLHGIATGNEVQKQIEELLAVVGLAPWHAPRYPHEFSGGQRQRIGVARALAVQPKLIVCDEPVSALDVSIQAQIINLLKSLQKKLALAYIFISHDLSVVKHISDRVAVMYLGKIVEIADKHQLYHRPRHPYTQALLSSIPLPEPRRDLRPSLLEGDVPSPIDPPSGCHFHPRCRFAAVICRNEPPTLKSVGKGHSVSCHLEDKIPVTSPMDDVKFLKRDEAYQKRLTAYEHALAQKAAG